MALLGGLVGGIAGGLVGRVARSQMYDISGTEPAVFGVAGLVMVMVALAAAYLPVRRASRVDPMAALRCE